MKAVGSILYHGGRQVAHDGFSLDMEVVHHGIAVPSSNEGYGESIDFANVEGHCARGPKAAGGYIFGCEA